MQAGRPALLTGADEGTRTPNLLITNQLLYQLSYVSRSPAFCEPRTITTPPKGVNSLYFGLFERSGRVSRVR